MQFLKINKTKTNTQYKNGQEDINKEETIKMANKHCEKMLNFICN